MSDLVERVTAAIKAATKEEVYVHDVKFLHATMDVVRAAQARAAIAAVAEWLDAWHKAEYLQNHNHASPALREQLEKPK